MKIICLHQSFLNTRHFCRSFLLAAALGLSLLPTALAFADVPRIGGTGSALGSIKVVAEEYSRLHPEARVNVVLPAIGSGGAIKALLAGALDIAISARPLSETERGQGLVESAYARTPFVVATGSTAKIGEIRLTELAAFYSGRTSTWKDGSPVRVVLRPPTDSDTATLRAMSAEMAQALDAAQSRKGMLVAMTDQESADIIEKTPGAIGSTTLALIVAEKRNLHPLAVEGAEPSLNALEAGRYPYARTFSLVTRANVSAATRSFVEYLLSPAGGAILRRNGQLAGGKH